MISVYVTMSASSFTLIAHELKDSTRVFFSMMETYSMWA
jgi:hypothetical protein